MRGPRNWDDLLLGGWLTGLEEAPDTREYNLLVNVTTLSAVLVTAAGTVVAAGRRLVRRDG